jgi:hypothetical protein
LIDHINQAYTPTAQRLAALRESGKITYDLLWALFKPNTVAYTTCSGTKKLRCIRYDFGEEKIMANGIEYFHIEGRYLDFDGKVFGEVPIETGILKFRGSKLINSLDVFPLEDHQNKKEIKAGLIAYGQKFHALTGVCHRQYKGMAFQMKKGEPVILSVNSRIIVDAAFFRQINSNYTRPSIASAAKMRPGDPAFIDLWDSITDDRSSSPPNPVKIKSVDRDELKEDDFLLYSPTVLGFSLDDKLWRKSPLFCMYHNIADLSIYSGIRGRQHHRDLLESLTFELPCYQSRAKEAHSSSHNVSYEPNARSFL